MNTNKIIIDLDDTICNTKNGDYENSIPKKEVIQKIKEYKSLGFEIIIYTSRNMRTYEGNVELIKANTLPIIIRWLERFNVPYDQIVVGKPWPSFGGFYVDDKAIRPDEFVTLTYSEIQEITNANN
tara:strand:+ start:9187 stop:9564 length:378 start_codon:yes stop_codon:yes gene_type:complete